MLTKAVLSIDSQIDKIHELFKDVEIVEVLKEQKSAFKPYDRPVFDSIIERIKAGEAQGIIAWHPDRLSRNEIDAATVTYMIRTGQIKDLKFGSYTFENSPEGIWMLQMALSQSQYSSAKLSKDVKRGMEKKVQLGWFPGVAVEGYLNDRSKDKGEREIISDPVRLPMVKKMLEMMLTGAYTPPQIRKIANEEWGYTTVKRKRVGGNPLGRSTIYKMFNNILYAGMIEYKGQYYQGKHEPIISLDEFDRVQMLLGKNGRPRAHKHEFAFTGCVICGECGCQITAETKTKWLASIGQIKQYTYYHCTHRKETINCTQRKHLEVSDLETQIKDEIAQRTILPEFRDWALEVIRNRNDDEVTLRQTVRDNQDQTLRDFEHQLDNLTQMRYKDMIDDERFMKEKEPLEKTIKRIRENRTSTEDRADKWRVIAERAYNFAASAREEFDKAKMSNDFAKQREILLGLGENFTLMNGQLTLEPNELLVMISEKARPLEARYRALELSKNLSSELKTEAFAAIKLQWLPLADILRTQYYSIITSFDRELSLLSLNY